MWRDLSEQFVVFIRQMLLLDSGVILLVVLVIAATIVIDLLLQRIAQASKQTGLDFKRSKSKPFSIEGTKMMPVRNYVSKTQLLSGRPDAVLVEDGFYIPVEHKPLSKKVRDRHVAQLLVYMRLVEEFEGRKPPYGYLIIGKNSRRVRISNTKQRQEWLDCQLNGMRAVLQGAKPIATPQPKKCLNCRVKEACEYRVDGPA